MRYLRMLIPCGVLCAAPLFAASQATPSQQKTSSADRLLKDVKADAQMIQSHAMDLENLAKQPNAQWAEFDRQWNEIKPAQESLDMRIRQLESMRSSLTDSQRKDLDQVKQASQTIAARTRELYQQVDQQGANLQSPRFRADARSLAASARTAARAS